MLRLETNGLLTREDSGRRNKREFAITSRGAKVLEESWTLALQGGADLEMVLRGAAIALLLGERKTARHYLDDAHQNLERAADSHAHDAESFKDRSDPVSVYMWMRSLCESRRREAESKAISDIREQLKEERHVHQQ